MTVDAASGLPLARASAFPAVTAEQMREVDRVATEELGLGLIQMMENAGRHLAELVVRRFGPRTAVVLAGPGGNGGGGLVAARHLGNRGVDVAVVLAADRDRLGDVPRHQLSILERSGARIDGDPEAADVVLDALIGYSLDGDPRGRAAELIRWANDQAAPACSLDVPSGLQATSGAVGEPCVHATATLTLALPKVGLARAPEVVGELSLADLGIPRAAFDRAGIATTPIFAAGPIVRLV